MGGEMSYMSIHTTLNSEEQKQLPVTENDWQQVVAGLSAVGHELSQDSTRLIELGEAYLKGRLVGQAEECFRAALRIVPDLSLAHYYLGYLYSRQGRHREAALEFGKCLAAQPRNDEIYAELGLVYFKQGRVEEARALWQQGLLFAEQRDRLVKFLDEMSYRVTLDGEERVVPNLCRMAFLAADNNYRLALAYLERARWLEPFNPVVFTTYAHVFATQGKNEEAETAWQEAIRLAPSDPAHQAGFAAFLLGQGKCKDARTWAERAVMLAPREAEYRLILARAEAQNGNLTAAEQHLRIARDLEPEQPAVNYELGRLLWQRKEVGPALAYLRKAARAGHREAKAYLTMACRMTKGQLATKPLLKGGSSLEQIAN